MKRMKSMKGFRAFTALLLAVVMILGNALAGTYYIEDGDVVVHASETSQTVTQADHTQNDNTPVISNRDPETPSTNTVTIKADEGCTANVTVKDLNIDVSTDFFDLNTKWDTPTVKTEGAGDVNIELDGNSSIKSSTYSAGLQKENEGTLTINDANQNGKLEATGGQWGAGIGGGYSKPGKSITITGGEVTAKGGGYAAGIGGGANGEGTGITISGGKVTATSEGYAAGIGGGSNGEGTGITISGGKVIATSEGNAAGIGGGYNGEGKDITISGGEVTAMGGVSSAGIGGGNKRNGINIKISGGEVTATGGDCGAGIGGGQDGDGEAIQITGSAWVMAAGGGNGYGYEFVGGKLSSYVIGTGAAIGDGGNDSGNGEEIQIQTSDLTCGSIEYYAPGTKAENIKNGTVDPTKTVQGTKEHKVSSEWTGNSKTHWHTCSEPGCAARIDEAEHTPAGAVKENEKPAQVGKAGSYDEVIYCSVCHRELSRETVTTDPLPEKEDKKMPQGNLAALCAEMAKQIRQAPENGTVEMDAGSFDGLTRVVFKALSERPDVTLKLNTKEGVITIPAGAGLLEKIGGKNKISFAELKDMIR